jgi:transposase-like protein
MIDLKRMVFIEKNYQPFTMERLEEWSNHRTDLESCFDYESSLTKRLSDNPVYEHANAIMHFNGLVIDLKLMVSGLPYDAFTEERIAEADKYFTEIWRCQKRRTLFY